jgi:hypothetical protein
MRIAGIDVKGPNESLLVLPRGDDMIPFRARAILDFTEFNELCPEPKPPMKTVKGGKRVEDREDPNYQVSVTEHERRKLAWVAIKSLEPSEIEWETVDMQKPGTWVNYQEELKGAGFSPIEINRITDLILEVNCLDESKLKWAREVFVQGQQASPER